MRTRDYVFMIRDVCPFCGYTHDTPKHGHEKEYTEWMRAKTEESFNELEDY
jgi:hypothetical protein